MNLWVWPPLPTTVVCPPFGLQSIPGPSGSTSQRLRTAGLSPVLSVMSEAAVNTRCHGLCKRV